MSENLAIGLLHKSIFGLAIIGYLMSSRAVPAQSVPEQIPYCTLANNPKTYDGKTIRVRGTLNVEFEDFSLWSKGCKADQGIWLAFGGDVPTPVASMVNDTSREPGSEVEVDGVSYGIKKNEDLRRLNALIAIRKKKSRDSQASLYEVTATLTGVFLAGEPKEGSDGITRFLGYGHLGCCSLFVITEVSDVESNVPANLDVRGTVLGPDGKPLQGIAVINDLANGAASSRQQAATDATGGFSFSDAGQLLQVEDPRFRPYAGAVKPGGAPVRVRLKNAKATDWTMPYCQPADNSVVRIGVSILFTLPSGWQSQAFDDDTTHAVFVFPPGGSAVEAPFLISQGVNSEAPTAFLQASYIEQHWIKDESGAAIGIESRVRYPHEGDQRSEKFFDGETAAYGQVSKNVKPQVDQLIASACVARH